MVLFIRSDSVCIPVRCATNTNVRVIIIYFENTINHHLYVSKIDYQYLTGNIYCIISCISASEHFVVWSYFVHTFLFIIIRMHNVDCDFVYSLLVSILCEVRATDLVEVDLYYHCHGSDCLWMALVPQEC